MVTARRPAAEARDRDLHRRTAGIRLLLTDCDGTLTDGGVYCSLRGEELLRFSRRDGMGVARLRAAGIAVGIVSQEPSPIVAERARKLGIEEVHLGATDKRSVLQAVAGRLGIKRSAVAFLGDDLNDLPALASAGLSACPADAVPEVRSAVDLVLAARGGFGALRELADRILEAQELVPVTTPLENGGKEPL